MSQRRRTLTDHPMTTGYIEKRERYEIQRAAEKLAKRLSTKDGQEALRLAVEKSANRKY